MSNGVEQILLEILVELQQVNSQLSDLEGKFWSVQYDVDKIREYVFDLS